MAYSIDILGDKATYIGLLVLNVLMRKKKLAFRAEQAGSLPQLSPLQLKKLKHLTIVSLAAKCRVRFTYTHTT